MMGFLDQKTRETFSKFIIAIAERNEINRRRRVAPPDSRRLGTSKAGFRG